MNRGSALTCRQWRQIIDYRSATAEKNGVALRPILDGDSGQYCIAGRRSAWYMLRGGTREIQRYSRPPCRRTAGKRPGKVGVGRVTGTHRAAGTLRPSVDKLFTRNRTADSDTTLCCFSTRSAARNRASPRPIRPAFVISRPRRRKNSWRKHRALSYHAHLVHRQLLHFSPATNK